MRVFSTIALVVSVFALSVAARPYVLVLGVAQDAGVPQMGCDSPFCRRAWNDAKLHKMVSSIAIVDPESRDRWIFDATPDLPRQFQMLKDDTGDPTNTLSGIFLTHAHIGHYTGLMYLGRESMSTQNIPVYTMPRMKKMLESHAPWQQLAALKNIEIRPLMDRTAIQLNDHLTVEPFLVPHRDEFSETVGFRISSKAKTIVFIPDIDKWQRWQTDLKEIIKASDYLFLDGTFYADGEIARPMSEVPHPFVSETMDLLKDLPAKDRAKVFFIHFNHSNPLVQGDAAKIRNLRSRGFNIATQGMKLSL
ncbi:MAG TPA: MBL fold metallo-hydrolase [Pyrinomonadaceae bacterium]|nr:MBL fold metallo-hydrolase [Pyrinomonadaceae bacterium]